jgi:hypothetical protein
MRTLKEASVVSGFQWVSGSGDAQIDALVYELYRLAEEEIGVVEGQS